MFLLRIFIFLIFIVFIFLYLYTASWVVEVVLLLTAKFTVSGSFNLLFLYTAELFPTEAR